MRTSNGLALALLLASLTTPVHAQDAPGPTDTHATEARALFDRGRELAQQRRYSEAADSFRRSVELVDRPSSRFNLAVCYYVLDRYVEATEHLERYLQTANREEEGDSWDDALEMITHARRSVSRLVVEVLPADATVTIDGRAIPGEGRRELTLNPGPHVVRVEAEAHQAQLMTVETAPGETLIRAFQLVYTRRRPRISVRTDGPEATIRVDGEPVGQGVASLEVDPGAHVVEVGGADLSVRRELELDWDEHTRLELRAPPQSSSSGSGVDESLLWVSISSGVAAVALAVILSVVVASQANPSDSGSLLISPVANMPILSIP